MLIDVQSTDWETQAWTDWVLVEAARRRGQHEDDHLTVPGIYRVRADWFPGKLLYIGETSNLKPRLSTMRACIWKAQSGVEPYATAHPVGMGMWLWRPLHDEFWRLEASWCLLDQLTNDERGALERRLIEMHTIAVGQLPLFQLGFRGRP